MECCKNCKFLYPLKKFIPRQGEEKPRWERSYVCLALPFTEEKDEICYAIVIGHPEEQMCEMFDDRESEPIPFWRGNMKGMIPYQGEKE